MPKENKKRGRRADQKRKLDGEQEAEASKRPRYDQDEQSERTFEDNAGFIPFEDDGGQPSRPNEIPFYGVLDEQESEYFHKAGEMLEVNQFSGPEDREDFVRSVYEQAEAKELKMAFSQGTSRVLERLILLSNTAQLKHLFKAFTGK
jgi:nucleolar protein 9